MPDYGDLDPPAPRSIADVETLLDGGLKTPRAIDPLSIVLVAGPKDHNPGEHDYPAWQKIWSRLLREAPQTNVEVAWEFPSDDQADSADVMVFYQRGSWNAERAVSIDRFLERGGGLVYIHWAVDGRGEELEFAKRIGLACSGGAIAYRHGPLEVDFSAAGNHPIARNFSTIDWIDESYWRLTGDPRRIRLLGASIEEGQPRPLFWSVERGVG
ncbi:MAG: ThuA domain-containing protein, partial [Planctomycetota bacterium]